MKVVQKLKMVPGAAPEQKLCGPVGQAPARRGTWGWRVLGQNQGDGQRMEEGMGVRKRPPRELCHFVGLRG